MLTNEQIKNLGPTLKNWRRGWNQRLEQKPESLSLKLPLGKMKPAGYIVMQHVERKSRPVKSYRKWVERIPETYRKYVLEQTGDSILDEDPNCLGMVRNYQSLAPMAQEARKPIFFLKSADGAIGAHSQSVRKCYCDFKQMTETILKNTFHL